MLNNIGVNSGIYQMMIEIVRNIELSLVFVYIYIN